MAKKSDMFTYSECPHCGKENVVRDRSDKGWCNNTCQKNYKFDNRDDVDRYKL